MSNPKSKTRNPKSFRQVLAIVAGVDRAFMRVAFIGVMAWILLGGIFLMLVGGTKQVISFGAVVARVVARAGQGLRS